MTQKQETQLRILLTEAHKEFERGLRARACFKVNDRAVGEDLVQETFMRAWKYLVNGGKIEAMKSFLYHILNNLIIDEYRKRKTTSLDTIIEKGFELSSDNSEYIVDCLDGRAAFLLIKHLPKKYQKVMTMRYGQLLSLKEMSLATGQTKNTMAVQAHRGLEKLRLLYNG